MRGSVACVIPAYDAERALPDVARGLRRTLPDALVIVVDDGSRDGTLAAAREHADIAISLGRNCGKGAALRRGIGAALEAGAAAVLTVDADGQHDPTAARALVGALAEADIVIGARDPVGGAMPWRRRLTNGLAGAAIASVAGRHITDTQSGYRAIRRPVLEQVTAKGERYDYETDFLIRAARAGYRISAVPVQTIYGPPSHFRPVTDSLRVVRAIWRHRRSAAR